MDFYICLLLLFILGSEFYDGAAVNGQHKGKWPQIKQEIHSSLRIIHGKKTDIKDLPFTASSMSGGILFGSSVVANKRWILTTAFSVYGEDVNNVKFRVGSNKWKSGGQVLRAEEIHIHPKYSPYYWDYNIAVVKTRQIIRYRENVRPANLGTENLNGGTKVKVAGWGVYNKSWIPSDYLLSTNLTVLGRKACAKAYTTDFTKNLMCTASNDKTGPCTQDFGDPLVVNGTVYGLYAGAYDCNVSNSPPQLYTNIPALYQWVKSYVDSDDDGDEYYPMK